MVLFHLTYNINFYRPISWYDGTLTNKIWQLSIAISFFIISGITSSLLPSKENIKRGIKTSLVGFLISLTTYIFAKEQLIIWGVMNGLGLSMILTGLFQRYLREIPNFLGLAFILLFVISYNIPSGSLLSFDFFDRLYQNNLYPLGFPSTNFRSSDYFPIIPWLFSYLSGFCLGDYLKDKNFFDLYGKDNLLAKIGRCAMPIYLIHQVILYPLVSLFFN